MKHSDCAARKQIEERCKARRAINQQVFLAGHQNIGGVIVPTPLTDSAFHSKEPLGPHILQKSALPPPDYLPLTSLATDVIVNDQAAGFSITDTSLSASQKDYRSFSNTPRSQGINNRPVVMSQTGTPKPDSKFKLSQSGILNTLHMIREPVVDYQESRGVPRNEEITFLTLVTSLCTQAYTAAITILVMLWNLMPLVDGLIYFVRFLLDKTIDIVRTDDNKDRAIKAAILFGELTIITFIIFMIVGLIFMPVYVLMARLFSKIFSMIAW